MHTCTAVTCASALAVLAASAGAGFPAAARQKICLNGVWDFKAGGTTAGQCRGRSGVGDMRRRQAYRVPEPGECAIAQPKGCQGTAWMVQLHPASPSRE